MYYFLYSFSDSLNLNRLKVINLSKCGIIQLIFPERIGCYQVTGLDVKSLRDCNILKYDHDALETAKLIFATKWDCTLEKPHN